MKKLLISLLFPGVFLFLALPVSSIRAATNTFDCKWNSTSCRAEAETYADCNDGYKVDSDYCTAITDKDSCKKATNIACVNSGSNSVTSSTSVNWYNQGFLNWYSKVYDESISPSSEIFGERYTAAQVQWILYSLPSTILNLIPGNPDFFLCVIGGQLSLDNCMGKIDDSAKQLLGMADTTPTLNQNIASAYLQTVNNSPISGLGYVNTLVNKLSPISTVKAADNGYGFTVAQSVIDLWRLTRNLSYSLIVLATIVIAFMIMFRVKINPQTVISIQSAIPKLIVTLVLITFSYAIAGLLIDIMYLVIAFISVILTSGSVKLSGVPDGATGLFNAFTHTYNAFGIMYNYWFHSIGASAKLIGSGSIGWGTLLTLATILMIIPIVVWSIKIFVVMVKNFTLLMVDIFAGPLQIMLGAITNKIGFGSWLRSITSHLVVYPILCVIFFFSFFFLYQGIPNVQVIDHTSTPFVPRSIIKAESTWNPPFSIGTTGASGGSQFIWIFVSIFIFSQATKVVEIVQSFFSGKPFDYGSAVGEAVGYGKRVWGETVGSDIVAARKLYLSENKNTRAYKIYQTVRNIGKKRETGDR